MKNPLAQKPMKLLRRLCHFGKRIPYVPFSPDFSRVQLVGQDANDAVRQAVEQRSSLMVAKFGTVELSCIRNHLAMNSPFSLSKTCAFLRGEPTFLWWWEDGVIQSMGTNAGLFPATEEMAAKFAERMLDDMRQLDFLASYIAGEKDVVLHLPACVNIDLDGYYAPFRFARPWTKALEGRKVLVVHPFEESIRSQYERRDRIWHDPDVLPEFHLETIKAVQSAAGSRPDHSDWFAALAHMEEQIERIDFDIALIGCGAYGFPLCAHVKRMGKQAVHLAGWTQVLFGISGGRWASNPTMTPFINDAWIRPSASETPPAATSVENGCYW